MDIADFCWNLTPKVWRKMRVHGQQWLLCATLTHFLLRIHIHTE